MEKEEKRQQRLQDKSEKQQALLEKKETFLTKFRKAEKYPAEDVQTAAEEIPERLPAETEPECPAAEESETVEEITAESEMVEEITAESKAENE